MDPMIQPLHDAYAQTLSPNPDLIKQAEAFLKSASQQPQYGIAILKLISANNVQPEIKQAAAVGFKNYVKFNWVQRHAEDLDNMPHTPIPNEDKDQIKAHITDLMLSAPPKARAQLSEALSIMSLHDFPHHWQGLLPQLIAKMDTQDAQVLNGVLATADSIYQRYRGQYLTPQFSQELEHSQQVIQPLLVVTQGLVTRITAAATAAAATTTDELAVLLEDARLACEVFYSLNSPGLTEEFEDVLDPWMAALHSLLELSFPALTPKDEEKEGGVDALKATVCECLSLFMERNEQEFAKYLETFVQSVWTQLMTVTQAPGQDRLAITAIGFLTAVARSVHYSLFGDQAALRQVCEGIVVPNLRLRDDDEEAFEFNWVEYVRRDVEGSDNDTRRRAAAELLRALGDKFPSETTTLCGTYVTALLEEGARDWKSKDAAMHLMTALAVKSKTAAAGVTSVNHLIDVVDFFTRQVAPELADSDVNARPIIKADALRFATMFRSHLPRPVALDLFIRCVSLLRSESNVVHSYAALLVDRLLASKENGKPRFNPSEIGPQLQPILESLFGALQKPDSGENEYVMRAVVRLVSFVGPLIAPAAPAALRQLSSVLLTVCQNPTQPVFNHFMFEAVAALVKFSCQADAGSLVVCEELLFPPFQMVLQQDVQEFHPYVFQILALLIEQRPTGSSLPPTYMQLLPPLLSPVFWERLGNIPALVRLLRAYLSVAAREIASAGHLPATLGVFQKLVSSKAHDHEGIAVLDSMVCGLDAATLTPFMQGIWGILFQRLQSSRTPKFTRCFVYLLALMVAKQGAATVLQSMDTVQPGVGIMVVQSVWIPALVTIRDAREQKVIAAGAAGLLCDAPQMSSPEALDTWSRLLNDTLNCLAGSTAVDGAENGDEDVSEEFTGYAAAFAKLHHASRPESDPLPEIMEPKLHLARALAAYCTRAPGRVPALVQKLGPEAQQVLQQACQQAGVGFS